VGGKTGADPLALETQRARKMKASWGPAAVQAGKVAQKKSSAPDAPFMDWPQSQPHLSRRPGKAKKQAPIRQDNDDDSHDDDEGNSGEDQSK
jgi:hypothetical protein